MKVNQSQSHTNYWVVKELLTYISLEGENEAQIIHVNFEISENIKEAEDSRYKYLKWERSNDDAKLDDQRANLLF